MDISCHGEGNRGVRSLRLQMADSRALADRSSKPKAPEKTGALQKLRLSRARITRASVMECGCPFCRFSFGGTPVPGLSIKPMAGRRMIDFQDKLPYSRSNVFCGFVQRMKEFPPG